MVNYRLLVLTAGDRRRGILGVYFFFFKQETAYEISECDWSSDECSSDSSSDRSEEHTSELQSHSEISYAVRRLKKKKARHEWELDEFLVDNEGLIRAEIELGAEDETFERPAWLVLFFFFNDTATTEIYTNLNTLSLHDALPISMADLQFAWRVAKHVKSNAI